MNADELRKILDIEIPPCPYELRKDNVNHEQYWKDAIEKVSKFVYDYAKNCIKGDNDV